MARGAKKTIEEKIAGKQEIISALECRLVKEKEELKQLINEQRLERLEELEELISNSHLSMEEVTDILKQHTQGSEDGVA